MERLRPESGGQRSHRHRQRAGLRTVVTVVLDNSLLLDREIEDEKLFSHLYPLTDDATINPAWLLTV